MFSIGLEVVLVSLDKMFRLHFSVFQLRFNLEVNPFTKVIWGPKATTECLNRDKLIQKIYC